MAHSIVTADEVFGTGTLEDELRRANAALGLGPAVRLATISPRRVDWLWPGRIPLGKLTVLDGDPGLGKSTITLDIAARVSRGLPMPDGAPSVDGGVVLAGAEDDIADTIRPRLDASGADCERIAALPIERWSDIGDLDTLRAAIAQVAARLVVVDPFMAYLPAAANSWRDQDVRRVLAPLAGLAAETGVAVVLVRHLNKATGGSAIYRGGGSIGIIGAARSGLLVAKDPDDPDRRVLAVTKSNLSKEATSLTYRTTERNGAVAIEWLGQSSHPASTLLEQPTSGQERSELSEASDWLEQRLSGGPTPSREVQRDARDAGISVRTLERARAKLGVLAGNAGRGTPWTLRLPDSAGFDSANPLYINIGGVKENPMNTRVNPETAKPDIYTVGGVKTDASSPEREATTAQAGLFHEAADRGAL